MTTTVITTAITTTPLPRARAGTARFVLLVDRVVVLVVVGNTSFKYTGDRMYEVSVGTGSPGYKTSMV